jgi:hypothetical protein
MPAGHLPVQAAVWFKSSFSGGNATECVECSARPTGMLVRDSKADGGPIVPVGASQWAAFVRAATTHQLGPGSN